MGKKKSKNQGEQKNNSNNQGEQKNNGNNQGEQKNNGNGDGGKKDNSGISVVVLKLDLHCECDGCASKIMKCIRGFDGVESVKGVDGDLSKITVIGKVDPAELREKIEQKIHRNVELVSPSAKKAKDNDKNKDGDGEANKKKTEEKPAKKSDSEEKKSKEPPVTTVVLKVPLHCEGCIQKIKRAVRKTRGYLEMSIDPPKDLVTVKGAIDGKLLAESLKEKLKRPVEIVQPKKEGGGGEKGKGGGGEKGKEGGGGGGGGKAPGNGQGGGDGGGNAGDGVLKFDEHRMQYGESPYPYPYAHPYQPVYGMGHVVHAPQIFSDENPNACSVM